MATTNTYSVSSVSFPTAEYNDGFISFEQTKSTLEQGLNVNLIAALSGARDSRINNYSSFYLTGKNKLSNFISVSSPSQDTAVSLVTNIGFERPNNQPSKYFYIFKSNEDVTADQKALGIQPLNKTGLFQNNYSFEIEALNNNLCRIKHNDGLFDFYLNYNNATGVDKFVFYRNTDDYKGIIREQSDVFRYVLDDDGYLQLFKFDNNVLNIVTLSGDQLTLTPLLSGSLNRGINNLMHVDYSLDQNNQYINNSFAKYNVRETSNLILDTANSNLNGNGQYMLTTAYNTISADNFQLNYLTLDTNRSEFNFIKRGSNMIDSPIGLGRDPREYYNLNSGNNQEKGLDKINLNYSFYDKDIFIENGSDTFFVAPSSIYPYEKLNINDSQFIYNGAFAGPTPILADKIFIKRQNTTQYDNGRYLCTWLSGGNLGEQGLWVDRYYYPDKISKRAALSSTPVYAPSFLDSVDTININVSDAIINKEKFFDKISDAAIEPNIAIKYQRIGNADIKEIVDSSAPLVSAFDMLNTSKIVRGETENFCTDVDTRELTFNGSNYTVFNVSNDIDKTKNFTLNFDMYLDPANQYGFELLGNNTNRGFGIFQDQTVTPFIHVVSDHTLYIFNTDFELRNKIEFKTKIKQVFKRSALDDYIVTTSGNLFYKVNTQGNKIKLDCGSDILEYIGYYQMHNNIDFISGDQNVRRINTNTFSVSTLSAAEFDVYKNEFCLYDNVIEYNDAVYKLPGTNTNWENDSTVFYQVSDFIVKHDLDGAPEAFLKTDIKDFLVAQDKIYILKPTEYFCFNTSGIFELSGSISNINIPNPVTETTVALSGGTFISIDWVNEYRNGINFQYPILLAEGNDDKLYLSKGTMPSLTAAALSGVSFGHNTPATKLTNYNVINHLYDSSSIDFKLTLTNYLDTEDILNKTISFDPSNFEPGFYNFTYRLDTLQGNSTLYINAELYENQTFSPGKYMIQDIFSDKFFIGSTGFQSNMDLSTYLKQPGYYYTKDLTIRNPFVYDRAIDTELVYALYLVQQKLDDIVLSLPAGQRTSKTEIQQFFKFNRNNSSNHIDIVVRNLNITDVTIREQIKASILAEAKDFTPVGVIINDVVFKDY
tara:strand:+ start:2066 stop:5386 length:3321 start_codon:yes stop_codon:yes gene_type:complete